MANCDARRWERSIKKSFGYSKESSYGDVFDYPQLRFWLRIVKINFVLLPRIQSPASFDQWSVLAIPRGQTHRFIFSTKTY